MLVQEVIQTLNEFWREQGCILWQPYHTEVGAGTSNPATFLRAVGPEPWWVAYPEPSIRPDDGRYAENPNRLQHYYQYQVILKPSPPNVQELFLQSLEALGLDLTRHDFRFVEDNWQSPSLGAWGLGWEAWLDGMEVLQFTYFQECGGMKLDVRACELTYGVERIAMYLQDVDSVFDLVWAPSGITYGDIFRSQEIEYCKYNFEEADIERLFHTFDAFEAEAQRLLEKGLVLPAYDHTLRLSHLFNVLDARGALSVTERGRFLLRCRGVAEGCARAFHAQREEMGFPLCRLTFQAPAEPEPLPEPDRAAFNATDTLLLEVGVEELPHRDVRAVLDQGAALFTKLLDEHELEHGAVEVHAAPRRIGVLVRDCAARQRDVSKEVRGPKKQAAQDKDGNWTMPAKKFAEGNGVTVDDIYFEDTGKGEYCFVKQQTKGKHLVKLLSGIVEQFLRGLQFGRTMGWEDSTAVFSRPVRWLVALHGANPVPVSWTLREESELGPARALVSGAASHGHRRLGGGPFDIPNADAYLATLRDHLVLADRDERMRALRDGVAACAAQMGLTAEEDDDLYDEVCDLVEWPEPIVCEIPEEALSLPEPIVITPMKVHQRYIPLRDADGAMSRHFVAVANGDHGDEGRARIREGNEKVLNARLRDAKYFWDSDIRTPLRLFGERLENVMFHQKLGTVADKVNRLRDLYFTLHESLPGVKDATMEEVFLLMKADLTTQMVSEFSSLEGVVGMLYAREQGVDDEVARAILDHRLPRRAGDAMPEGLPGLIAGLLDRLDTLAGYFGIGIRPKGTSDPFGLRRNTLGLLAVIQHAKLDIDLETFARAAIANYGDVVANPDTALNALLGFIENRLEAMARDQGHAHDYVAAALAVHYRKPNQFFACLDALAGLDAGQVQALAEQAKRMGRIVKEPADTVRPDLLTDAEKPLYDLCTREDSRLRELVSRHEFEAAFAEVLAWVPVISDYFEQVLVNDEDDAVRMNRHAMLRDVLRDITTPADFTRIEKREA